MIFLRSLVLALVFALLTPPWSLIAIASFPFKPFTRYRIITVWTDIVLWVVKYVCRIDFRVLGAEHIPRHPSVVLSKHQSAWETMALQHIFPPQVYVLKRELLRLPFFGWGLAQLPMISIDRSAGKDALAQVLEQGKRRLAEGFWVVVFPEGTRTAPGSSRRYKPGGAYLAAHSGTLVVPVAHNAGEFWRRRAFLKYPGTITVSVGEPINPAGLTPEEINRRAHTWIESEMRRLFPHHYSEGAAGALQATAAEESNSV